MRSRRGQSGVTLIEVLVGIAVMVPLTLASVSGLMFGIKVSASTQTEQRLEVALTAAAEDLKSVPYLTCGTSKEYQQLLDGWGDALDADVVAKSATSEPAETVVAVEYWDSAKGRFRTKCSQDDGAQRLRVTVTTTGGAEGSATTATGTVVKRNALTRKAGTG